MENNTNYTLVGLFVLVLTATLIGVIIWLNAGDKDKHFRTYEVLMTESISGLNLNARVKYRGVDVGQVSDISLVPEQPDKVRLLLDIDTTTPINQETVATLNTQGFTGLAYLELSGGDANTPPLKKQPGQYYPRLQTGQSLFVRFDTLVSSLLEKLQEMSGKIDNMLGTLESSVDNVNGFLSEENQQAVTQSLQHVESMIGTLAQRAPALVDNLDKTLANSVQLSAELQRELPQLLQSVELRLRTLEGTLNSYSALGSESTALLQQGRPELMQTLQALRTSTQTLNKMLAESSADLRQFTSHTLPQVGQVLSALQGVLQPMRRLAQNIEQQPNQLLFGKPLVTPGPGEK